MKIAGLLIIVGIAAVVSAVQYRRLLRTRDTEWESRWRMLPIRDRLRIARAARRGERLDDPSEATLAAGSAQYQQQLLFNSRIGDPRVQLVFAFVVTLIGVLARSPSIVALGLAIIALSAWRLSRLKARRENLAQAEEFNGIRPSGRSG